MYTPPPTKRPGHPRRSLSEERHAAIVEALKAGGSVTSVSAGFGLDRATVRRIRDGTGGLDRASPAASVVVTARLRAFMAELAAERRRKGLRLFERFIREEARNG